MIQQLPWLPADIVRDLGWSLIHFLWQGLILAAFLQMILRMCRNPVVRHNVALAAIFLMASAPVMTFHFIHGHQAGSILLSTAIASQGTISAFDRNLLITIRTGWIDWVVIFWIGGIGVLSLRALGGFYLTERMRSTGTLPLPGALLQRCQALQARMGLRFPVLFLQSLRVSTPVVIGWLRPVILIPLSAITGLTAEQLDALVMHELAHISRSDALINFILIVVETVLFYHPAVWWVSNRVRVEREHCCDDIAVSNCTDPAVYVEALTFLESWKAAPVSMLAANSGQLKERAARLLGAPAGFQRYSLSAMAPFAFFCLFIATLAFAQPSANVGTSHFSMRVVDESTTHGASKGRPGEDLVRVSMPVKGMPKELWLKRQGQIDGNVIAEARLESGRNGKPIIEFRLTPTGRDQFAALTQANIGNRIAIVVNGTVIDAPRVREAMTKGTGEISGQLTQAEARALVAAMMETGHSTKH